MLFWTLGTLEETREINARRGKTEVDGKRLGLRHVLAIKPRSFSFTPFHADYFP